MRSRCSLMMMMVMMIAYLALCNLSVVASQHVGTEDREGKETIPLDGILQRAENNIIRSILMKMGEEKEDSNNALDDGSLQPEWVSKRQHPGKREDERGEVTDYLDAVKRQHPGKRGEDEGGEDEDDGIDNGDFLTPIQKRQHPGKRETVDGSVDAQKRQHPGRRSTVDELSEDTSQQLAFLGQLAKRQHPGKRYLTYPKRQHPGRRSWEDERDTGESVVLERRQHPGKRYLDAASSDLPLPFPCDPPTSCRKASLLLELLEDMNRSKSQEEEKRQHPGRSLAEVEGQD